MRIIHIGNYLNRYTCKKNNLKIVVIVFTAGIASVKTPLFLRESINQYLTQKNVNQTYLT